MRALVTGGGGFIGSHVCEALVAAGHDVRVVDRDPVTIVADARTTIADLNDHGVADAAVAGVDVVIHQAARVGLGLDYRDAPGYVADNDLVTARLLAALTAREWRGRLVLASSMVVYGEGRYRCAEHGAVRPAPRRIADLDVGRFEVRCPRCGADLAWSAVPEDAPLEPRSVYAATKVAQEHLASVWAAESGSTVVALRYHNVYGPRLPVDTPYAGVAAIFRSSLRRGEAATVFEDGGQTRDFVHVRDVARANLLALDAAVDDATMIPVNVCSGRPATIGTVAGAMTDAFGPGALRPVVTGRYRSGDVRHVVASPGLAEGRLGFVADIDLADGLAEMAAEGR